MRPPEELAGLIERVTYHQEESGFSVLRVSVRGERDLVTVLGNLPTVAAGEWLTARGQWVQDRDHGRQFRASELRSHAPQSRTGIEKYLGSGMVKGIGPVYAHKLVERFGEKIFDVIEQQSARLEEVPGIGPERRRKIKAAWNEQKAVRAIMVFLHSHGVSTSRAVRIYKTYGDQAIEIVQADPYRLAREINGIGFHSADKIALALGISPDSLERAGAALAHQLLEATQQGHAALPEDVLLEAASALLTDGNPPLPTALQEAVAKEEIVLETVEGVPLAYLPPLHRAEIEIASRMLERAALPSALPEIDAPRAIQWCEGQTGKVLAPRQREAIHEALSHRVLIITGGPGVGKTTLIDSLLRIVRAKGVRPVLCAPTGRAARRLAETSGLEAQTIHRLLGSSQNGFQRHSGNPLAGDLFIVDESSMVDLRLMASLLKAIPLRAHLILVGDVDQLPSVGPGQVLANLIECGRLPVVRLTEIFRQAAGSKIITNAHRINEGALPEEAPPGEESDFFFIPRDTPEAILATLETVVRDRLPVKWQIDPVQDVQVLTPMNRSLLGARELNRTLQAALNPPSERKGEIEKFGVIFRLGDKVMQTRNNYLKEVFNGDIGRITALLPEEREVRVTFEDQREVEYDFGELDEITLAYAVTIHKSQGSEFPIVVIPLAMQHFLLLQRNLLYTGVTRGRKVVVLIGQPKALSQAVRNRESAIRYTALPWRLQNG